jgi:hypothetical protein
VTKGVLLHFRNCGIKKKGKNVVDHMYIHICLYIHFKIFKLLCCHCSVRRVWIWVRGTSRDVPILIFSRRSDVPYLKCSAPEVLQIQDFFPLNFGIFAYSCAISGIWPKIHLFLVYFIHRSWKWFFTNFKIFIIYLTIFETRVLVSFPGWPQPGLRVLLLQLPE